MQDRALRLNRITTELLQSQQVFLRQKTMSIEMSKKKVIVSKLRHIARKWAKPLASLLFKRNKSYYKEAERVEPELETMVPIPIWCRSELDENVANEAIEAKIQELLIHECTQAILSQPANAAYSAFNLKIEGRITVIPVVAPSSPLASPVSISSAEPHFDYPVSGTFWTCNGSFHPTEQDICWRDYTITPHSFSSHQKAEQQMPN